MIDDKKLPLKEKFLEYYRKLPVLKLAAGKIGRDEDSVIIWKKEDSDFSYQVDVAKSDWAMKHTKKVKSEEWLLERILKDHFAELKQFGNPEGETFAVEFKSHKKSGNEKPTI